ncbi:MAG TPA: PA14 domain-containing protein, partial [Verrucomicrobiae bacterium]|nr:PA14 domain-containing protein [Verrucomicrobiae bacterium]
MLAMLVIIPRPATGAALVIDRQSITNVAFFQERSALQASQVLPLDVHGLVTFVDAKRNLLVLQDGARATAFHVEGSLGNVQPGQRIQIEAARCSFYNPAFPEFPLEPSGSVWLPTLSSPTNHDNYYLSRMHGYLIPPTTGDYTFWIASKSSSDLWLSTNADADGLRRLAFVPAGHATLPEEWDKYSTQSNGPIRLEAGRPYLFDVLQEHRAGRDDTVAVAWQGPGLARTVVEGRFLAPYSNRNTNGVVWEYWDNYFLDSLEPLTAGAMASEVEVKDPKIRILGDRQFPEPIAISIGAELSPDQDFRWAEVQGTVEFAARGADALILQLEEEHARLTLKLPPNAKLDVAKLAGAQVRARGVCEPVLAENGKRIASVLLVPSEKEITRVGVDTAILGKLKPVSEGDIVPENPRLASGRRIRVRGKVLQRDGDRLLIQGPARLSGFVSTNGTEWMVAGPAVDLQLHESALAGLLASSFDSGKLTTAQFGPVTGVDALAQTEEIAGAMPAGRDLAHPEGTFDVVGGGTGFGTGFERLHYFCEPLEKKTEIVARLTGLEAGDAGSTAGIMVRDALDPRSSFAALTWGRDNKVTFRFRQGPRERSEATNCVSCPLPCWLKLSRTDPTLEVRVGDGFAARVGDIVDLVGYLGWDGRRPFLSDACRIDRVPSPNFLVSSNAVLSDGAMDSPVRSSLARLVPERGEGLREGAGSVLVRGVVTFAGDAFGRHYLVIQDDTAGAALNLTRRFQRREPEVGQLVELELDNRNGKWPFPLVPIEMRVLGRARAPEPVTLATANTMLRQGEYRWVECKGIVRAAGPGRQLELDSPAGLMAVSIGGGGETNLAGDVDALVRLRGVLLQRDGKAALLTPSAEDLEVLEPAPADPFGIPTIAIADLNGFSRRNASCHRVRVSGVVTYRDHRLLV